MCLGATHCNFAPRSHFFDQEVDIDSVADNGVEGDACRDVITADVDYKAREVEASMVFG